MILDTQVSSQTWHKVVPKEQLAN